MNDFDFDVMQKKRIANNAAHMKRGSKSKKCSLPSDHMTPAEWKRRNGPVSTYSLNKPMDWETFKSLPVDIQQSYIDILQSRFNVTTSTISKDLFDNTPATLKAHMDKYGLKYIQMKGRNMTAEEREIWKRWLSPVAPEWAKPEEDPVSIQRYLDANAASEIPDEKPEPIVTEEEPAVEETKSPLKEFVGPTIVYEENIKPLSLDELTAVFTGVFSPATFLDWVSRLPIPYDNVRIKVEVTRR